MSKVPRYIIVPNFIKIGQMSDEILQFFNVSRWRMAAMLDFHIL